MASRRNLSLAGALVALVALVALASRAHAPAGGGGGAQHLNAELIWEYVLIGVLGVFAVSVLLAVWTLWSSRGEGQAKRRQPKSLWQVLFSLGSLGLTAAVLTYLFSHHRAHFLHLQLPPPGGFTIKGQHGAKPTKPIPFDWLPAIVVLSVAAVGAVVVGMILFRRPARRKPTEAELAAQLSAVLDDSLDDLLAERDARRAVIATYARMERTLAGAGLPRAAAEAPLEYLGRVLRDLLHTSAEAVSKLTTLFERAKFSHHEIDTTMKDEAIDALVSLRDELRAVAL
jgi:Domain of unknown function (DUF4129)